MPHNPEKIHNPNKGNPLKQILVIRRDLKMRRGKECAQSAHASMKWLTKRLHPFIEEASRGGSFFHYVFTMPRIFLRVLRTFSSVELAWMRAHFKKVVVIVSSEEELLEVHKKALEIGLESQLVQDSGKTEFGGVPTYTACGIGPDHADKINPITGHLKLY